MQVERFDLAVQMQGSGVYSNPFTLMLGARLTAGFVREGDAAGRLSSSLVLVSFWAGCPGTFLQMSKSQHEP